MSALIVDFPHQRESCSSSTKIAKVKKSVSISPMSSMLVYKRSAETDEANLWLTSSDYQSYKADRLQSIRDVLSSIDDDFDVSMMNGLENILTTKIVKTVYSNRKRRCQMVLKEQARQWEAGIDDPEMIASVSRQFSEWSVKRALQIGSTRGFAEVSP